MLFDSSEAVVLPLSHIQEEVNFPSRFVLMAGGRNTLVFPQLWNSLASIDGVHQMSRPAADIDVLFVKDAVIGGRGSAVICEGSYLWDRSVYPSYIRQYYIDDVSPERWAFRPAKLMAINVPSVFSIMHFNYGYGHWLTEIFPKLFIIRILRDLGVTAPIAWPSTVHAHLRERTEAFLPGQTFVDYDPSTQYIAAEKTILPGYGSHDHFFHPILKTWYRSYATQTLDDEPANDVLFISRGELKHGYNYRNLVNTAELERIAASMGAKIYHPEIDPPEVQAARYAKAIVVIGEYGSGLHNTVFSSPGTLVVALNWIGGVQSRITNLMGQRVGYVLPDDNIPRLFMNDGSVTNYSVDVKTFRTRLGQVLEAASHQAASRSYGSRLLARP